MNEKLKEIHDYFIKKGEKKENLEEEATSSVYLATQIMEYAHRNQKRENGEDYALHPCRCLAYYRKLIGIGVNGDRAMDEDLLYENKVPFWGVQEVCLLHDVIEDTEFTMEDIRGIYVDCGFERYFDLYIKSPLAKITHDKSVGFAEYLSVVMTNPISALVKMMDLQDNLYVIDLIDFTEEKYERSRNYLTAIYAINSFYNFLENAYAYRTQFKKKRAKRYSRKGKDE